MKITAHQREKAELEWNAEKERLKGAVKKNYGKLANKLEYVKENVATKGSKIEQTESIKKRQNFIINEFLDEYRFFYNRSKGNQNHVNRKRAATLIKRMISNQKRELLNAGFDPSSAPENGYLFEAWVARSLRQYGWEASVTTASGDQGVDVIATKSKVSIGIQCKRYSGSVGNKAVQEAFSGTIHLGLDKAALLTNAKVTRSAQELAASTGVILLTPEDIPMLDHLISG